MSRLILNSKLFLTLFFLIAFMWVPPGLESFESLKNQNNTKQTCNTSCHLPENILKTKESKTQDDKCKSCHIESVDKKKRNPFNKPTPFFLLENVHPNQRVNSYRPPSLASKKNSKNQKPTHHSKIPGMAFIEAGEFIMGSNERWDDESPEHINQTDAFYIDTHEVTNENYKMFTEATQRKTPHHWPQGNIPPGKEKHPVIYVSWFDANDYCKWKEKRLPNEQEWEKAARGIDGNIYPWGNVWDVNKSNNPYKNSTGTEPVGSYPEGRSPYGLFDMSGNVWEWVDAYYLPHPGNTIPKAEYGKDKRVLKGGSWFDCLSYGCGISAPTFNRSFFNPEVKNNSFGFRCAKTP